MEETKINYQKEQEKLLKVLKENGEKPTLLLHVCCGPCFTYPFELIKDYFKITIIYNNSNIYPEEEYHRRLNELKGYLKAISADIEVIEFAYDNLNYNKYLEPYADQREGMERCRICFRKRLGQAIELADERGFDAGTLQHWTRLRSGVQIVWGVGSDSTPITFLRAFNAVPVVAAICTDSAGTGSPFGSFPCISAASNTGVTFHVWDASEGHWLPTGTFEFIAVGTWS